MSLWAKRPIEWVENGVAHMSIPFTWQLQKAAMRASALRQDHKRVRAGGPAVSLCPDRLPSFVEIGGEVDALKHHNPDATFTSRGCIRQCSFCAVPRTEGCLVELREWEPKPIVCDNNLLACSRRHFDRVVDSLKTIKEVDFNQGLDARELTCHHADRLAELDMKVVRLSWDNVNEETAVMDAITTLNVAGIKSAMIRCYVLIGFEDTPEDALYRLEMLRAIGVWPNVQRYQPLTAKQKNKHVAPGWTAGELTRYAKYWNRLQYTRAVPFVEFRSNGKPETINEAQLVLGTLRRAADEGE